MFAPTGSSVSNSHTSQLPESPSIHEEADKVVMDSPNRMPSIVDMHPNSPRAALGSQPNFREKARSAASLPFQAMKALFSYVSYHFMARKIMSGNLDSWLRQIDHEKFPSEIAGLTKSNARYALADQSLLKRIDALADTDANPTVRRLFKHLRRDLNSHHGELMKETINDIGLSQNYDVSSLKRLLNEALRETDIDMQHAAYKKNFRLNLERCTDSMGYADLSKAQATFDAIDPRFCKTEAYAALEDALETFCLVNSLSSPAPRPVWPSAEAFVETLYTMKILVGLSPEKIRDRKKWQEKIQLTTHSLLAQLNLPGNFISLEPTDKGIALEQRAQEIFEIVAPRYKTVEDMQLLRKALTDLRSLYFNVNNPHQTLERFYEAFGDKIEARANQLHQARHASPTLGQAGRGEIDHHANPEAVVDATTPDVDPGVAADQASINPPPSPPTYRPTRKPVQV